MPTRGDARQSRAERFPAAVQYNPVWYFRFRRREKSRRGLLFVTLVGQGLFTYLAPAESTRPRSTSQPAHSHGKKLYLDVQVEWDHPELHGASHGQDYSAMLRSADRLVVWDYFGLAGRPPERTTEVVRSLKAFRPDSIILSVGLWPKEGAPVSPEELRIALLSGMSGGIANQWVTPSRFLTQDHWSVLADVWAGSGK